jgi:hypothetical protein
MQTRLSADLNVLNERFAICCRCEPDMCSFLEPHPCKYDSENLAKCISLAALIRCTPCTCCARFLNMVINADLHIIRVYLCH